MTDEIEFSETEKRVLRENGLPDPDTYVAIAWLGAVSILAEGVDALAGEIPNVLGNMVNVAVADDLDEMAVGFHKIGHALTAFAVQTRQVQEDKE